MWSINTSPECHVSGYGGHLQLLNMTRRLGLVHYVTKYLVNMTSLVSRIVLL